MVVASLLYAVCLYRAYGALDTLSPYIYYELLIICTYKPMTPHLVTSTHMYMHTLNITYDTGQMQRHKTRL